MLAEIQALFPPDLYPQPELISVDPNHFSKEMRSAYLASWDGLDEELTDYAESVRPKLKSRHTPKNLLGFPLAEEGRPILSNPLVRGLYEFAGRLIG